MPRQITKKKIPIPAGTTEADLKNWRTLFTPDITSVRAYLESFRIQLKEWVRLPDGKLTRLVPYRLERAQAEFLDLVLQEWNDGHGASICCAKGRQDGLTLIVQMLLAERAFRERGFGITISRKDDQNQVAFRYLRDAYRQVPEWVIHNVLDAKLVSSSSTVFELEFNDGGRSLIRCVTSRDESLGHGDANSWIAADEFARWPGNKESLAEAWASWANSPGNFRFVFSTAKGKELFHRYYVDGTKLIGGWKSYFNPWLNNPRKRIAFDTPDEKSAFVRTIGKREEYVAQDELNLVAVHHASPEQLHWRRQKLVGDYKGDVLAFKRQHPTTPEEAFLAAESQFFPLTKLEAHSLAGIEMERTAIRASLAMGDTWNARGGIDQDCDVSLQHSRLSWGPWRIFHEPQVGVAYAWGCDPAEGKQVNADGQTESDFATIEVREVLTERIVAQFRTHMDPPRLALELLKVSSFYGGAPGFVEENNHGQVVIDRIEEMYERSDILLRRRRLVRTEAGKKETFAPGFKATRPSKHASAVRLLEWLEDLPIPGPGEQGVVPFALIEEMQQCQKDDEGWFIGSETGHDDLVTAGRLCCEAVALLRKQTDLQMPVTPRLQQHERMILLGAAQNASAAPQPEVDRDLGAWGS